MSYAGYERELDMEEINNLEAKVKELTYENIKLRERNIVLEERCKILHDERDEARQLVELYRPKCPECGGEINIDGCLKVGCMMQRKS